MLELVTGDVKNDVFKWFTDHIQVINDVTSLLEQSKAAADDVGENF